MALWSCRLLGDVIRERLFTWTQQREHEKLRLNAGLALAAPEDEGIPVAEAEKPDVVIQNFEEVLAWLDQENPEMALHA